MQESGHAEPLFRVDSARPAAADKPATAKNATQVGEAVPSQLIADGQHTMQEK